MRRTPTVLWGLTLALVMGLDPVSAFAQVGSVTGRVRDAATLQPIPSAQLQILSTQQGGLTNANGQFLINNVPVGPQQIQVIVLGYGSQTQDITVQSGQVTEVNFDLSSEAISLEELVITATGEQRARQISNKVTQLNGADLAASAPVTDLSDLLVGKSAGVQIIGASGAIGTGSRIRIRGSSSISLSNEPVIILDGIRIESNPNSSSIGVGGQSASRLSDINPEEIESIEVVRGPSAATLYGTDAANGVIRITTKRGALGSAAFQVYAETGLVQDVNDYYANWDADCFLIDVADGTCSAQANLSSWNPLMEDISTPYKNGSRQQYGVNVTGGTERLNYFVSGEWETEDGVLGIPKFDNDRLKTEFGDAYGDLPESLFNPNSLERLSLRANFGGQLFESLNFNTRVGYISSTLNLPNNDNNVLGLLPSALLGTADGTDAGDYGYGFFLPSEVNWQDVVQEVDRFIGSGSFDWRPLDFLQGRLTVGLDQTTRTDIENLPREQLFFGATRPLGTRTVNTARIRSFTFDANMSANFQLTDMISSRTTLGTQYFMGKFTRSDAFGADVVAGCSSLTCTGAEFAVDETTTESRTLGLFVDQEFGLNDRLFVNAAVRMDDNSAFGQDFDAIVYPKLGTSWVISEEPFFPQDLPYFSSLRLRAAWGASGAQPGPTDALRFYNSTAVTVDGQDVVGVTIGELGNPDLEPEQSSEIEAGFDLSLLEDRIGFNATYYAKTTTDLLIQQPLPPSGGVGTDRFVNLGEVTNKGFEVGIDARLLESPDVIWDMGLQYATNANKLVDLGNLPNGDPIPEIKTGEQWYTEGYPLAGYWDFAYTYDDANGDGIIGLNEVTVDSVETYLGSSVPTRDFSAITSVTLFSRVRLNALVEYRGGHKLHNLTESFRCGFAICQGLYDPEASLDQQARAVAGVFYDTEAGHIEDASFWKLRELGATFFIPESWVARMGANRAELTLTARNLLTITDYTGADPEVNGIGNANFRIRDFLTQPPVRTFVARVNISF